MSTIVPCVKRALRRARGKIMGLASSPSAWENVQHDATGAQQPTPIVDRSAAVTTQGGDHSGST
jgi:hypothetical protein